MSERITIEELESYLWNSAVLLRSSIDAGAYKQYIFPLLFFKRICDVYDEETQAAIEEYGEDIVDLDPKTGRCAILFPHGILFRDEEKSMRIKLVKSDLVECVIGIGKNLFFNSPMEACIVICRTNKPTERRGKILFINAKKEVTRKNAQSYLEDKHISRIARSYFEFDEEEGFSAIASVVDVLENNGRLSISLYVRGAEKESTTQDQIDEAVVRWNISSCSVIDEYTKLSDMIMKGNNSHAL